MAKKNVGSSFDEFLEEEGFFEKATAAAVKRGIAFQLAEKMSEHSLSKSEMARRMATRWAPRQFAKRQMPRNHLKRLARPTGFEPVIPAFGE